MVIDSDEYVLKDSDWEVLSSTLNKSIFDRDKGQHNVYAINLQTLWKRELFLPYPQIRYMPNEINYYENRHYYYRDRLFNKNNFPHIEDHTSNIIQGLKIGHNHLRSKDHEKRISLSNIGGKFRRFSFS